MIATFMRWNCCRWTPSKSPAQVGCISHSWFEWKGVKTVNEKTSLQAYMEAAWEKNLEVRPEKDWEQLKGRAVVDEG